MSASEFLARHSSAEIAELFAFYKLEEIDHKQEMDKAKQQSQARSRRGRGR